MNAGGGAGAGVHGALDRDEELEHARRRARVARVQRARMLASLCELCAERGVAELTVAKIVSRAGVSRRTFYEQFASVEECLLAALEEAIERASERARTADDPAGSWRQRIRASLGALLAFADEQPSLARLLLVDSLAAGPEALALREGALARAVAAFARGAPEGGGRRGQLSPLTAEGTIGGVLAILHARVQAPASARPPLLPLLGQLMSMLVLPYLGPAAAAAELKAPAPAPSPAPAHGRPAPAPGDLLQGLDMRLTYRTMRMLAAVADNPGGSNRTVGHAAGMEDQGQISKLLRRLTRVGLIENVAAGSPPGSANAWRITARGQQLSEAFTGS